MCRQLSPLAVNAAIKTEHLAGWGFTQPKNRAKLALPATDCLIVGSVAGKVATHEQCSSTRFRLLIPRMRWDAGFTESMWPVAAHNHYPFLQRRYNGLEMLFNSANRRLVTTQQHKTVVYRSCAILVRSGPVQPMCSEWCTEDRCHRRWHPVQSACQRLC